MRKRWDEVLDRLPDREATLVEVGVWRGDLSARLLSALSRLRLVLVDPWLAGAQNAPWQASGALLADCPPAEIDAVYHAAMARLAPHADRVRILRLPSLDAAAEIADGSCDAVFLDAIHSREAVSADIRAWWPKVRAGGWIGGHDYGYPRFPGVAEAVGAAFTQVQRGADWTWFVQR